MVTFLFLNVCLAGTSSGLSQLAELLPSNAGQFDNFGSSVAITGNVIAVTGCGGICVYIKPSSGWRNMRETATLTASDGAPLTAVAASGHAIVGVSSGFFGNGAAYVFVEPNTGWTNATQTAKLTSLEGAFLSSVAIDASTIVGGASAQTVGSNQFQGEAYVFVEPSGGWANMTETATLTASDGAAGDEMGFSVAISGSTIAAGAPFASTGGLGNQGGSYVFVEPVGGWLDMTQTAKVTASDGSYGAQFGRSLSISGNIIAVGAPTQYNAVEGFAPGTIYVFVEPSSGWVSGTQTAELTASNGISDGEMGFSVAVVGKMIVAGSPGTITLNKRQEVYEFLMPASGWQNMSQTSAQTPPKGFPWVQFGYSVGSNGNTIVVGAPGSVYSNDEGVAFVFGQ
jgi:hypothetical protein